MATSAYMNGRKKYGRPQAMLWADNPGRLESGAYIPNGFEVGYDDDDILDLTQLNQFIILSDHNRKDLGFSFDRIEQRERMINGRMRSYHVADKLKLNVSWDMLPSRSFANDPNFSTTGATALLKDQKYTADGGAGGVDILDWYKSHPGPFWVYLAYDKHSDFKAVGNQYGRLAQYNQVVEMYIADFSYAVVKRGTSTHDFWNISVSLEEV
jgi:hypothetical protein